MTIPNNPAPGREWRNNTYTRPKTIVVHYIIKHD